MKKQEITIGFESQIIELGIEQIMPLKIVTPVIKNSGKYKQIMTSIQEVGIIEPPVVTKSRSSYILLDGHLRIQVLKDIGESKVSCLVSKDDESFTYNKHINRISTIQEHKMILRAIERGVPEAKIAKALNIDVRSVIAKRYLLSGVCEEAIELLKDKIVPHIVFIILKRMKPFRQVEVAGLMNDAATYSGPYAKALLAATPQDQLKEPERPKKIKGMTPAQMGRMELEMNALQKEYKLIEETYGTDVLNLVLAKGYLSTLLGNAKIVNYLAQHHAGFLEQFRIITEMKLLEAKEEI